MGSKRIYTNFQFKRMCKGRVNPVESKIRVNLFVSFEYAFYTAMTPS